MLAWLDSPVGFLVAAGVSAAVACGVLARSRRKYGPSVGPLRHVTAVVIPIGAAVIGLLMAITAVSVSNELPSAFRYGFSTDWIVTLAVAGVLAPGAGVLGIWGYRGERARGRARCPRCWYDLDATPSGICPECGLATDARSALRPRRRPWAVVLACVLLLGVPGMFVRLAVREGSWQHMLPDTFLILATPWLAYDGKLGQALTERSAYNWRDPAWALDDWELWLLRRGVHAAFASRRPKTRWLAVELVRVLPGDRSEFVPHLLAMAADENEQSRGYVLYLLAEFPEAVESVLALVPAVIDGGDVGTQRFAAKTVATLAAALPEHPELQAMLVRLRLSPNPAVRQPTFFVVRSLHPYEASRDLLLDVVWSDPCPRVRSTALLELLHLGVSDDTVLATVNHVLENGTVEELQIVFMSPRSARTREQIERMLAAAARIDRPGVEFFDFAWRVLEVPELSDEEIVAYLARAVGIAALSRGVVYAFWGQPERFAELSGRVREVLDADGDNQGATRWLDPASIEQALARADAELERRRVQLNGRDRGGTDSESLDPELTNRPKDD